MTGPSERGSAESPSYSKTPGSRRRRFTRAASGWLFPRLHHFLAAAGVVDIHYHPESRKLLESNDAVILALWHEFVLALLPHVPSPERTAWLLSPSKDGKILARSAQKLGFQVIEGSSRLGGANAMTAMLGELAQGRNIVITPDGPMGPAHEAKSGVAKLSALSGEAIIPMSAKVSRHKRLNNWDRLVIPLRPPRLIIYYHAPVFAESGDALSCLPLLEAALSSEGLLDDVR